MVFLRGLEKETLSDPFGVEELENVVISNDMNESSCLDDFNFFFFKNF